MIWCKRLSLCVSEQEEKTVFAALEPLLVPTTLQSRCFMVERRSGSVIAELVVLSVTWITAAALVLWVHISALTTLQWRSVRTADTSDKRPGLSVPASSMVVYSSEGMTPTELLKGGINQPALRSILWLEFQQTVFTHTYTKEKKSSMYVRVE